MFVRAATLIINILEVNTEGPVFGPPWTPSRPRLDLTVREEMAVNSYVTTIVASDPPTDAISKYTLFNNDAGFFKIEPKTGRNSRNSEQPFYCDPVFDVWLR